MESSKELFKLSRWKGTDYWWERTGEEATPGQESTTIWQLTPSIEGPHPKIENRHPAYSLNFLRNKALELMGPEPNQYPKESQLEWEMWVHDRNELAHTLLKGPEATAQLLIRRIKHEKEQ